ncbi:hypothetical protein [Gordoniibacillus kamchatkensis]|nr:hypothetical protein [Paenibacillus sp. VKM B-2647]
MMPQVRHFYCSDCKLRFAVFRIKRGKRFCPECGDTIAVSTFNPEIHGKPIRKKPEKAWTLGEERKLLHFLYETDLYYKEIAVELGRTLRSVQRKIERKQTWIGRHQKKV